MRDISEQDIGNENKRIISYDERHAIKLIGIQEVIRDGGRPCCVTIVQGVTWEIVCQVDNSGVTLHNMFYSVLGSHVQEKIQEVIRTATEAENGRWTDNTMAKHDKKDT